VRAVNDPAYEFHGLFERAMTVPNYQAQVRSVGRALPPHYVDQESALSTLRSMWQERAAAHGTESGFARLESMHRSIGVEGRYLAMPAASYREASTFGQRNDAWIEVALGLGARATTEALDHAGLSARDVDHIFFVTVTGIATPGIDARLVNRLGFRTDVKRTPIFGLGCVAGAAGTARASDYLTSFPHHVALLLSVELCSLTFQPDDLSMANIIASGLFGDGAASVVLTGTSRSDRRGARVVATRSVFYPDTEELMGWRVVDNGFKIVLAGSVPQLARRRIRDDVDSFLGSHGLTKSDISHWIAHTGGPKLLVALEEALDLPFRALARSWDSLRKVGNLSSASVLFVLGDLLDEGAAKPGDLGVMLAMGPGFCTELLLVEW
jgi:alkylresorcinol/alkylpyrone synthase